MAHTAIRYLFAPRVNRYLGKSLVEILASLEPERATPAETDSVAEAGLVIATDWEETLSAATRAQAGQIVLCFNTGDAEVPDPLPENVIYVDGDAQLDAVREKLGEALRRIDEAAQ